MESAAVAGTDVSILLLLELAFEVDSALQIGDIITGFNPSSIGIGFRRQISAVQDLAG